MKPSPLAKGRTLSSTLPEKTARPNSLIMTQLGLSEWILALLVVLLGAILSSWPQRGGATAVPSPATSKESSSRESEICANDTPQEVAGDMPAAIEKRSPPSEDAEFSRVQIYYGIPVDILY